MQIVGVDFRPRLEVRGEGRQQGEGPDCCPTSDVCDSERFLRLRFAGKWNGRVEEVACAGVPEVVLQI